MWHFQKTLCHITDAESRDRSFFLFTRQWVWDSINYNREGKGFRMLNSSRKKKPHSHMKNNSQFSFTAFISNAWYPSSQMQRMWYCFLPSSRDDLSKCTLPDPPACNPIEIKASLLLCSNISVIRYSVCSTILCQDIFTLVTHTAEAQAGHSTQTPSLLRLILPW